MCRPTQERAQRPLVVIPALARLRTRLSQRLRQTTDPDRSERYEAAIAVIERVVDGGEVDTVGTFERVLNGCLDCGYRARPLAAFVFEVLQRRFAARIRRRLSVSGQDPQSAEVADLVAVTAEAVQGLLRRARRERHSVTYALLISIADHRTIDYLRRKRPEYRETMDDRAVDEHGPLALGTRRPNPEQSLVRQQRVDLASRLRAEVLAVVNELPFVERAALILVEIEGAGYDEVARALGIKRTDVGNVVRRARLKRDRQLMPRLRGIPGLEGHVGFADLQRDRALRLNMLRWSTEMGQGVCERCMRDDRHIHGVETPCPAPAVAALAG